MDLKKFKYNIRQFYYRSACLVIRNGVKKAKFLKKHGVFYSIGNKCSYTPMILPSEPFLVKLGNNVSITADVRLITHDVIGGMLNRAKKEDSERNFTFMMGKIDIGNNVMVGAGSIILPNVIIGDNVIIGAGSVVTKDVPSGSVIGGNPARFIMEFSDFEKKRKEMPSIPRDKVHGMKEIISFFWER